MSGQPTGQFVCRLTVTTPGYVGKPGSKLTKDLGMPTNMPEATAKQIAAGVHEALTAIEVDLAPRLPQGASNMTHNIEVKPILMDLADGASTGTVAIK